LSENRNFINPRPWLLEMDHIISSRRHCKWTATVFSGLPL